jgi:hypothetical protein
LAPVEGEERANIEKAVANTMDNFDVVGVWQGNLDVVVEVRPRTDVLLRDAKLQIDALVGLSLLSTTDQINLHSAAGRSLFTWRYPDFSA